VQQVPQQVNPHRGDFIVLHVAGVDLSIWSSFDRLVRDFVQALWGSVHIVVVGNTSEELDCSQRSQGHLQLKKRHL